MDGNALVETWGITPGQKYIIRGDINPDVITVMDAIIYNGIPKTVIIRNSEGDICHLDYKYLQSIITNILQWKEKHEKELLPFDVIG